MVSEIISYEKRVEERAIQIASKAAKKSYQQNHFEQYKTGERWGLFGWGGNVYATRTY